MSSLPPEYVILTNRVIHDALNDNRNYAFLEPGRKAEVIESFKKKDLNKIKKTAIFECITPFRKVDTKELDIHSLGVQVVGSYHDITSPNQEIQFYLLGDYFNMLTLCLRDTGDYGELMVMMGNRPLLFIGKPQYGGSVWRSINLLDIRSNVIALVTIHLSAHHTISVIENMKKVEDTLGVPLLDDTKRDAKISQRGYLTEALVLGAILFIGVYTWMTRK